MVDMHTQWTINDAATQIISNDVTMMDIRVRAQLELFRTYIETFQ